MWCRYHYVIWLAISTVTWAFYGTQCVNILGALFWIQVQAVCYNVCNAIADMPLIQTKFSFGLFMVKCWKKYLIMVSILKYIKHCLWYLYLEPAVKPEKPIIPDKYTSLCELYTCQQALANWSVNDGRVDYNNFHLQLWKSMNRFPIMAEAKSRLMVPHALNFV